ncbi:MAG: Fic/DOC family N-terminal domain-containing protein [Myxococcales bacterium]
MASILPNPDLFVGMYVKKEAVLSSQIEGTQASLADLLQFDIGEGGEERRVDVEEVVNYVAAMKHGLARLDELPLSLRLIREIHGVLMKGCAASTVTPASSGRRRTGSAGGAPGCRTRPSCRLRRTSSCACSESSRRSCTTAHSQR